MGSEFELINLLTKDVPRTAPHLVCGVGDDCAVIDGGRKIDWLLTTDALIENIHFRQKWQKPKDLGFKALAVNLSDIAAMGGTPRFYLVSLGLPRENTVYLAKEIYQGMAELDRQFCTVLIGGDTVASPNGIFINITVIGECEKGKALYRGGAKPGDHIYVTGTIGSSALGFECLKKGINDKISKKFIRKHLCPFPRIKEGKWLAKTGFVSSMIDISDGLIGDLVHIAEESGVGFEIDEALVPRGKEVEKLSEMAGLDPLSLILGGGEDYELIFTVPDKNVRSFEARAKHRSKLCKVTRIGRIVKDKKKRPRSRGFSHF